MKGVVMKKPVLGAAFVAAMVLQVPAQADIIYTATLSGAIEATPNNSAGTGTALVTVKDVPSELRVQVSFENLIGGTTAAHIHCCTEIPFDVTDTAIVATTTPTFTGFPSGVTEGDYDRIFELLPFTATNTYNSAFVAQHGGTVEGARNALLAGLEAGTAYLNIHSTEFPAGEIRGFLSRVPTQIPEPSSMAMLAASIIGLGVLARRRKS